MKKWYFIKINSRNGGVKMDKHEDFITKVLPILVLFITTMNVFAQTDHRIKNLKQIEISGNHAEENKGNKTIINHDVMGGYKSANPINWFIKTFVFTKRKMKAETKHAIEEFKYFERITS